MRYLLSALALISLGTGCASAGRAVADDRRLATTNFAPAAEVTLSAMTLHPRGFYYRDVQEGTGQLGEAGRSVQISYVLRLPDGRVVDAARPEDPLRFRVGDRQVIVALDEAVRTMRAGGTRQLVVPPRLGYGARGAGPVPGNAILVMLVRLERVE